jgi:aspartyl-tRNA(Asn)/glutamyl-tRNA(Gln) amidotransferase subunit A
MAGHDDADVASVKAAVDDYRSGLHDGVAGLRIAVPRRLFETSALLSDEARANIDLAVAKLLARGALVQDIELPSMDLFASCGRVILAAEMYALHRRMLGQRAEDYHPFTFSRIAVGAALGAADYLDALRLRRDLMRATALAFAGFDAMLTAISLDSAPLSSQEFKGRDWPLQPITFNVTGHPAMSVPTALDSKGLPMGVQLVGHMFEEARLLRVAQAVEDDSDMPCACAARHL